MDVRAGRQNSLIIKRQWWCQRLNLCANVDVTFMRDGLKLHPELRPARVPAGHAHTRVLQEAEKLGEVFCI